MSKLCCHPIGIGVLIAQAFGVKLLMRVYQCVQETHVTLGEFEFSLALVAVVAVGNAVGVVSESAFSEVW